MLKKTSNDNNEKIIKKNKSIKNQLVNDDEFEKFINDTNNIDLNKDKKNIEVANIKYVNKEIKITDKNITYNKGEIGEIFVLKKIFELKNDCKILINIFGNDIIDGYELYDIDGGIIINKEQIKKSKSKSKADCIIELKKTNIKYFISIKCTNGSLPSILNHTPRSAKVFNKDGELLNNLEKIRQAQDRFGIESTT